MLIHIHFITNVLFIKLSDNTLLYIYHIIEIYLLELHDVESCVTFTASETRVRNSSAAKKIEFRRKVQSQTREDCFSAPSESYLQDFDFEKNLALFDKKAVFEEIESSNPELTKVVETKKPQKYRFDENVLQSAPVVYQQIKVPKSVPSKNSFVTG